MPPTAFSSFIYMDTPCQVPPVGRYCSTMVGGRNVENIYLLKGHRVISLAAGIYGWEGYTLLSKDPGPARLDPTCPAPPAGGYGMEPVAAPWPRGGGATAPHPQPCGCQAACWLQPFPSQYRATLLCVPPERPAAYPEAISQGALTHTSGCSELCLPSERCSGEGRSHGSPAPVQRAVGCLAAAGRQPRSSPVTVCGTGHCLPFPGQKNQK